MVTRPSMKSVGLEGIGSGFQRSRLGGVFTSSNGPERTSPFAHAACTGACIADGRSLYSQLERFSARGAVNAVPEMTSA